jgi:hypothetical protein
MFDVVLQPLGDELLDGVYGDKLGIPVVHHTIRWSPLAGGDFRATNQRPRDKALAAR